MSSRFYASVVLGAVLLAAATAVRAADYIVDTETDHAELIQCTPAANDCSLRGAIANANAAPTDDTVTILIPADDCNAVSGCIVQLSDSPLSITANGAIRIDGGDANRIRITGDSIGIFVVNAGATATFSGITVDGNGGGIRNSGNVRVINSIVSGGTIFEGQGSGIFHTGGGTLALYNSTVTTSIIALGEGGGIYVNEGTAILINSTVSGNLANTGGGIYVNQGTLQLINSTVTNNIARISSQGTGGGGGGVFNAVGSVALQNSIIGANIAIGNQPRPPDVAGRLALRGYNVIGNNSGAIFIGDDGTNQIGTSQTPLNPLLAPLGNYGGRIRTHALLRNSPAVNLIAAANNNGAPRLDARLSTRAGNPDSGAFEDNPAFVAELRDASLGRTYEQILALRNEGFTFSVAPDALPPGLTLDTSIPARPRIAGRPTAIGTRVFDVTITDANGSAVVRYSITVGEFTPTVVTLGGRVVTATGRGVPRARVTLTDTRGVTRIIQTNSFGFYRLNNVAANTTYAVAATAKTREFPARVVTPLADTSTLDFVALPQ